MADQGLNGIAWDSASSVTIHAGTTKIPLYKLGIPKMEIKVAKVRSIGAMLAEKRTIGAAEVADIAAEIEATYYEALLLPRLPKHGGTLTEFPITTTIQHPSVKGALVFGLDRCRIISDEGPEFDAESGEKPLIIKLGISVMAKFVKGRDGILKCLDVKPTLPSSDLKSALSF